MEADEHEVVVLIVGTLARVDLAVGIAPSVEQALVVAGLLVALVEQPAADELVPARRALLEAVDRLEHTEHERTPVVVAAEVVARRSGDVDLLVEVGPQERLGHVGLTKVGVARVADAEQNAERRLCVFSDRDVNSWVACWTFYLLTPGRGMPGA